MSKESTNLPEFKNQVASVPADRRPPPPRDPDGLLLAGDEAVRAALGSASLQEETVEPVPAGNNCKDNSILGRSASGTLEDGHPTTSATTVTPIPIAFAVTDAVDADTPTGNSNNIINDVTTPTQNNRDPRFLWISFACFAFAGAAVGVLQWSLQW